MSLGVIKEIIGGIAGPIAGIIDDLTTSKEEKLAAKLAMTKLISDAANKADSAARDVIVAEASSKHFLAANWRPITMLSFVFILVWNYVVAPLGTWIALMFGGPEFPMLVLPAGLWTTINIGLAGYIGARTYEKVNRVDGMNPTV